MPDPREALRQHLPRSEVTALLQPRAKVTIPNAASGRKGPCSPQPRAGLRYARNAGTRPLVQQTAFPPFVWETDSFTFNIRFWFLKSENRVTKTLSSLNSWPTSYIAMEFYQQSHYLEGRVAGIKHPPPRSWSDVPARAIKQDTEARGTRPGSISQNMFPGTRLAELLNSAPVSLMKGFPKP